MFLLPHGRSREGQLMAVPSCLHRKGTDHQVCFCLRARLLFRAPPWCCSARRVVPATNIFAPGLVYVMISSWGCNERYWLRAKGSSSSPLVVAAQLKLKPPLKRKRAKCRIVLVPRLVFFCPNVRDQRGIALAHSSLPTHCSCPRLISCFATTHLLTVVKIESE